jgi:DNA-binding MurR/RpiR family transcriptional regulator
VIKIKKNVLFHITNEYPTFSKSLKKIADYILSNTAQPQYLSIHQLAEICDVSESSVFRLCQILGFNGYKEFKYALAEANSATLTDGGIDAYAEILPEDSFGEMAKKLFAYNVASINQTLQLIDKEAYCQAAKHLKAAKHVYCFGQGASGIMAQELWGRFITVSSNFSYITDPHLQTIVTANCDKDDVIVLFSYSGATQDGPRLLSEAKIRGAKTILITHYRKSFASEFADIILLCGSRETPKQTGSIAAKMAQLFVIDLLFNEFYRLDPIEAEEAIKRTSVAMETKLLHENSKK